MSLATDAVAAWEAAEAAREADEKADRDRLVQAARSNLAAVLAAGTTPRDLSKATVELVEDGRGTDLVIFSVDGTSLACRRERDAGWSVELTAIVDGVWTQQGEVTSLARLGRLLSERMP